MNQDFTLNNYTNSDDFKPKNIFELKLMKTTTMYKKTRKSNMYLIYLQNGRAFATNRHRRHVKENHSKTATTETNNSGLICRLKITLQGSLEEFQSKTQLREFSFLMRFS